jgi:hypothetical protein
MTETRPNGTKPYIAGTTKKQNGIIYYNPNDKLVDFLRKQLHKRKEIEAGRESPEDDKGKRDPNLDRMKVHYLDNIFKAMADLSFFFEAIARHPELEKVYEDDFIDLLGIRRKKPSGKPQPLCGFMFYNLLSNILKVGGSPFERREFVKDLRLILNHRAEEIVRKKVARSLPSGQYSKDRMLEVVSNEANVYGLILGDFDRALCWTGMLASNLDKSQDVEEKPRRTFDFDTDKLLGVEKENNGESS